MSAPGTIIGQIQPAPQPNPLQTISANPSQLPQTQNTITTQPITMTPQQVSLPSTVQIKDETVKIEAPQPAVIPSQTVAPMEVQENGIPEGEY